MEDNHTVMFYGCQVEDDDIERLGLLTDLLQDHPDTLSVITYPGEEAPFELHAYIAEAPGASPDLMRWSCVLASPEVREKLGSRNFGGEASFQPVSDYSRTSIEAGIKKWIEKLWPALTIPKILWDEKSSLF